MKIKKYLQKFCKKSIKPVKDVYNRLNIQKINKKSILSIKY